MTMTYEDVHHSIIYNYMMYIYKDKVQEEEAKGRFEEEKLLLSQQNSTDLFFDLSQTFFLRNKTKQKHRM